MDATELVRKYLATKEVENVWYLKSQCITEAKFKEDVEEWVYETVDFETFGSNGLGGSIITEVLGLVDWRAVAKSLWESP